MIEIIGPALNQWDVGRSVKITNIEADCVHLANKGDSKAVIMEIADAQAKIPDYLLQTGKQLCVYAVKDGITVESRTFYVKKRERPENYVYEDDQRNYIYELITSAETAIEGASLAVEAANLAVESANTAAGNANAATENAIKSADSANEAAKNANEAATTAAHTAKNLMVIGEAEGANIALGDAIEQHLVGLRIFGKSTQTGTPTPDAPVDIVSVGDSGSITVNVAGDNEVQSMTIATPNGLPGIPVASGGNYTDANGQQWICDEIDFGRGVYVQRVGVLTTENLRNVIFGLNNGEDSAEFNQYVANNALQLAPSGSASTIDPIKAYCNIFPLGRQVYPGTAQESFWIYSGGSVLFVLNKNTCPDVASAKEYILKRSLVLYYILKAPIETPLSAEELASYSALHTYRDNTVVSNDASAHMEIQYVMDARKYIDSMISGSILAATVE